MSIILKPNQSLVSAKQALAAFSRVLESLDTPVSLSVWLQIKYACFDDLVNRKIDPGSYCDAASFKKDYQAVKGLSKAVFLKTSIDRQQVAKEKFWAAEEKCGLTNERFDDLMYGTGMLKLLAKDIEMVRMLSRARAQIHDILGDRPPASAPFRFGPGVTSQIKKDVTLPQKYSRQLHVTPELYPYWRDVVGPLWASNVTNIKVVAGNAISFVEKNAKTDRAIAIEPHVNVYAQLGIGQVLRDKLRRWVDLNTGQEVNRYYASQAHILGLATVDLESASDTISRSLVWYLLPEAWAELLDNCRSHRFTLDGAEYESNKFSSMGNGFTFELETIIFYALTLASGSNRKLTTCYGDDIIAEKAAFPELKRLLEYCGFTVNLEKTFVNGSFFESCGHDYFMGENVRPFFWKGLKTTSIFTMINDVSRLAYTSHGHYRDRTYKSAYSFLVGLLPEELKMCRIPKGYVDYSLTEDERRSQTREGYGDVGIISEWDETLPSVIRDKNGTNGWCGFMTKAMKFRPVQKRYGSYYGAYLASLDTCSETSQSPVRGAGLYEIGRLFTFGEWAGLGPWR